MRGEGGGAKRRLGTANQLYLTTFDASLRSSPLHRYELPKGDFPPLAAFKQALLEVKDLSSFQKLDKRMVKEMDNVFSVHIPELLQKARMQ